MANGQITKWGNSLALRIPATHARELGIRAGTNVETRIEGNALVVINADAEPSFTRAELKKALKGLGNRRVLVDYGRPAGDELL